ncbi:MAG: porin, partial [Myxococcota bacterium]
MRRGLGLLLSLLAGRPALAADDAGSSVAVSPYAVFVGGAAVELVDRREDDTDQRQGRFWTPALARIGLAGKLSSQFFLQSEVEFNAGPYGTSVWEGQAAIQVRNQLIRYQKIGLFGDGDQLQIEAGRVTDPASLNYVSLHIANLLLSDPLARFPLLTSGFNRGNGVRVGYTVADSLTVGFTVNGGNPTSTTATVMMGGTFPPFARFYEVPWSVVGRDARGFPASNFHTVVLSPSIRFNSDLVQAQVA